MSRKCNRCKVVEAQPSDAYCLACSAWEGIGLELQANWGDRAFRTLVTDILVSAARQIRGLRNLSSASSLPAGKVPRRIKEEEKSDQSLSPRPALPRRKSVEGLRTTAKASSKKREKSDRDSSEDEDTSEGDQKRKTEEDAAFHSIRDPDHRRPPEPEGPPPGHLEKHRSAEKERKRQGRDHSHQRQQKKAHHHPWKKDKPHRRHRAGRKHQRLERANQNPLQPLHRKLPSAFFEVHAEEIGREALERLQ